jgi:hypothetical protein
MPEQDPRERWKKQAPIYASDEGRRRFVRCLTLVTGCKGGAYMYTNSRALPTSVHFELEQIAQGIYAAIGVPGGAAHSNAGIIDLGDHPDPGYL